MESDNELRYSDCSDLARILVGIAILWMFAAAATSEEMRKVRPHPVAETCDVLKSIQTKITEIVSCDEEILKLLQEMAPPTMRYVKHEVGRHPKISPCFSGPVRYSNTTDKSQPPLSRRLLGGP